MDALFVCWCLASFSVGGLLGLKLGEPAPEYTEPGYDDDDDGDEE
jgi:hypothetical protein